MAIIYTYPVKGTPLAADLLLISDTADGNKSKNATIASLVTSNAIDVVDTVTASGAGITASPNKGDVVIANTGVTSLVAGSNIDISGSTGAVTISTSASNVDGSGTANTIPKWSDSNTLTDSPFTIDTSINSLDIPTFIRHIGDTDSKFGFQGVDHFRVDTGGQTTIQSISRTDGDGIQGQVAALYYNSSQRLFTHRNGIEVEGSIIMPGYITHLGDSDSFFGFSGDNNFILHTDSGRKIAAGPDTVTLYSDTSETETTTSVARFATATTGAIVYGQTVAAGAASERGGTIRYYNNANDRYVGISGPVTQGTSYQVRLPDSVGTAGQVLKLNTPIIGGSTQDLVWGDASSGTTYTAGTGLTLTGTVFNANVDGTQTIAANTSSTIASRTYKVQVDSVDNLVVNVPWTDTNTTYTTATSSTLGLVKIGYTESGKNYPVELLNDQMFVNVPWTDTVTPVVTASQGLTKTSNNITLDIADPTTGWAILGGGAGSTTAVIRGFAGTNATGTKNFGISDFISSSTVTNADQNVAVGFASMGTTVSTASRNVVVGYEAGESMTTALDNVLVGFDAGEGITVGQENTIIGSNAGETITTGDKNTIIGSSAAAVDGAASLGAVAIGRDASASTKSVAVGTGATVTGALGTAIGEGTSVTSASGIAIGQGCSVSGPFLGLASAINPIQTTTLSEPEIVEYLVVVVNGVTRYIALYSGTP